VGADGSQVLLSWSGVGCPPSWQNGASYKGGDIVEVEGVVYECSSEKYVNTFCGMLGYKPGDSLYWSQAWTELGSCSGVIAPTTSPNFVSLVESGGCPKEYQSGTSYNAGDTVTLEGNGVVKIVYKCEALDAGYCDLFPPNHDSKLGWKVLGYCSGKLRKSHLVVN
jgi:chitodextrinase